MIFIKNLLTFWSFFDVIYAKYWATFLSADPIFFFAYSVTYPAIILFLSLKRQSDPPKKQSKVITFYKNPILELTP